FVWLRQKWADLFPTDFDVLLYDLTSTYFEGEMEDNPKARLGYSRDGRPDCLQVVIALVITTDGFPLAYEVMNGNTSDRTTLRSFLNKIETLWEGQADVGHGSRHSDRRGSGGNGRTRSSGVLSGRNSQEQDPTIRTEVARSAVEESSRFGRRETV